MSTKQTGKKSVYTCHSNEFKQETLKLADSQGIFTDSFQLAGAELPD